MSDLRDFISQGSGGDVDTFGYYGASVVGAAIFPLSHTGGPNFTLTGTNEMTCQKAGDYRIIFNWHCDTYQQPIIQVNGVNSLIITADADRVALISHKMTLAVDDDVRIKQGNTSSTVTAPFTVSLEKL